jgi:hypothetical protein
MASAQIKIAFALGHAPKSTLRPTDRQSPSRFLGQHKASFQPVSALRIR